MIAGRSHPEQGTRLNPSFNGTRARGGRGPLQRASRSGNLDRLTPVRIPLACIGLRVDPGLEECPLAQPESRIDSDQEMAGRPEQASRWAWEICWLMFASTVLNYMDRQAIALVAPQIKGEFKLQNVDFGWVLAAFSLTYALFQVPAGYLVDRWNVRWTY